MQATAMLNIRHCSLWFWKILTVNAVKCTLVAGSTASQTCVCIVSLLFVCSGGILCHLISPTLYLRITWSTRMSENWNREPRTGCYKMVPMVFAIYLFASIQFLHCPLLSPSRVNDAVFGSLPWDLWAQSAQLEQTKDTLLLLQISKSRPTSQTDPWFGHIPLVKTGLTWLHLSW